jgi:FdhE protein
MSSDSRQPERSLYDPSSSERRAFNGTTTQGEWQRRIARAEELGAQDSFASEILHFYSTVACYQKDLSTALEAGTEAGVKEAGDSASAAFARPLPPRISGRFKNFISLVEQSGPAPLREAAFELKNASDESLQELLTVFWSGAETAITQSGPNDFFARAFLQPYAAGIRSRFNTGLSGPTSYLCPLCKRKPGVGVLRPLGDGGQRSLICSFCMAEWPFRRILCPGCGEGDYAKLPVYTAEEVQHVRVEACDSCRMYIKTVDMTKNGLAEPVVDEIAAVPLDLWAQEKGYTKLNLNLMLL